ncbi:MAG: hypothetical protein GY853_10420, partial [PVC group bacterium]|nr:hypothetical protein [PVC group bacterium]
LIPVAIVAIAYYIEESGGLVSTMAPENLELIFYIFVGLAVIDGALAIFLKQKLFFAPLIKSKETFVQDFMQGFFAKSIVCYALIAAIAIYGLVFYFLGGTFNQLLFLVIISFIAFQIIRPRHKFAEKVLSAQEQLVEQGQFLSDEK